MRLKRGITIGVFSAKGGVGKTTTVTNLGAALAQKLKNRVLLFEANMTASTLGLHLGVLGSVSAQDVVFGRAKAEDAIVSLSYGLHVLPGSPVFSEELGVVDLRSIIDPLRARYDVTILDSSPGSGLEVLWALRASDMIIVVCRPEVPAIAGTLQTLRAAENLKIPVFGVALERVKGKRYEIPTPEIKRTLGWATIFEVPEDESIRESILRGIPLVIYKPNSPAAVAFRKLASAVLLHMEAGRRVDARRKEPDEAVERTEHQETRPDVHA